MALWQRLMAMWRRRAVGGSRARVASATTVPQTDPLMSELVSALLAIPPLPSEAFASIDSLPTCEQDAELPSFGPRYQTRRRIAAGGMSEVYEAFDISCNRRVAIKLCRPGPGGEVDRFCASLLASEPQRFGHLEHENIVRVYEPGRHGDGRPWYAMEFVEGSPLTDYAHQKNLSRRQRVELMATIASAAAWMHDCGLLHLDLKPGNILVTTKGVPKILDFGLACPINRSGTGNQDGPVSIGGGTPGYRAPEIVGREPVGCATDVYSLGIVLHELLCGSLPVDRATSERPTSASTPAASPPPKNHLGHSLRAIVTRATAADPLDRYRDAAAMADELNRWLRRKPPRALVGLHPFYRSALLLSRHRVFAIVALLAAALTAALVSAVSQSRQVSRSQHEAGVHRVQAQTFEQAARRERQRGELDRFRDAFTTAREFCQQRRFDDAQRALEDVPYSQWGIECDFVQRQIATYPTPRTVVGSHDWGVVAILAGKGHVISAGQDGRLLVWDLGKSEPRTLIAGRWSAADRQWRHVTDADHKAPDAVIALAWIEHGDQFATASLSGTGAVWTLESGNSKTLVEHGRPLLSVAARPDCVAFGDDRGTLILSDRRGNNPKRFDFEGGAITALAPALGQAAWWIGHENGSLRLVDSDGKERARGDFLGPIWQLVTDPKTERLFVAGSEPAAIGCAVDLATQSLKPMQHLRLPPAEQAAPRACHAIVLSPDGQQVLVGDDLGRLCCFAAGDGGLVYARADQRDSPRSATAAERWPAPLRRRASLAFEDQRTLLSAGADTLIKSWPPDLRLPYVSIESVRPGLFQFDAAHPGMLWIVRDQGRLAIIDGDTGHELAGVATGAELLSLAACSKKSLVAVASEREISCWSFRGDGIESTGPKLLCAAAPICLALSPDGSQLASYSHTGQLVLWDMATGQQIADRQFPQPTAEQASRQKLAFNSTGSRIALFGDLQTLFVLDGRTLDVVAEPKLVAGDGGTALAWHPSDEHVLFAGDTIGRVARRPEMLIPDLPQIWTDHAPIAGLAITPDGRRAVAATPPGKIVVIDQELGPLYSEYVQRPASNAALRSLALNPTGRLMAFGFDDGTVSVLRLADNELPKPKPARVWSDKTLVYGAEAPLVRLHAESVALDDKGRLHALYLKAVAPHNGKPSDWRVVLGRESSHGWRETPIADFGALDQHATDDIERSLVLEVTGDHWQGFAKLKSFGDGEHAGDLYWLAGDCSESGATITTRELVVSGIRAGYDPALIHKHGDPTVLHFSHAGRHLLVSRRSPSRWTTAPVGRQGDGYRLHAVATGKQDVHVLFRPTRFDGDRAPALCLTAQLPEHFSEPVAIPRREIVDAVYNPAVYALASSAAGTPVAVYRAPTIDGRQELLLARRDIEGWHRRTIIARLPLTWHISNILVQPDGTLVFPATVRSTGEVWLVSAPPEGSTRIEPVWRDPRPLEREEPFMVALCDRGDGPVVLVARGNSQFGYIRVCRLQVPAGPRRP